MAKTACIAKKEKGSWLPADEEENIFAIIKAKKAEAIRSGKKIVNCSVGQPTGAALLSARKKASGEIMLDSEVIHEYQDNGSPGVPGFAERFVKAHVHDDMSKYDVDYLPIPGIKSMLGLVPMACGGIYGKKITVGTMTDPGYPTPKKWSLYLGLPHFSLPTNPKNHFRFSLRYLDGASPNLIMLNFPNNPTAQIATYEFLYRLCKYCAKRGIRIFNDAAYAMLSFSPDSCTLADVAVLFPDLSWAEAYSASKLIKNGTGWRVGAIVGSPDFIGDLKMIKGDTDSGFNAALAAGVLAAVETDGRNIIKIRDFYGQNVKFLAETLSEQGMKIAVEPKATFFTLWKTPTRAFGESIESSEHFNYSMIKKTGVLGVQFDPYTRYAGIEAVREEENAYTIKKAFKDANVSYKK